MSTSVTMIKGDIFNTSCIAVVNPVNTVGIMGKGLALQFKIRYPEMFVDYQARCKAGHVQVGIPYVYNNPTYNKFIVNFPTKDHWVNPSKIEWINSGLEYLVKKVRSGQWGSLSTIAFPLLGAGCGGLDQTEVLDSMKMWLSMLPANVNTEIYYL